MSLILDALNRADKERNEQRNGSLLSEENAIAGPKVYPVKRWIIEALTIVAVGIFALYTMRDQSSTAKTSELAPASISSAAGQQPMPQLEADPTPVELEPKKPARIAQTHSTITHSTNPTISALYNKPSEKTATEPPTAKPITEQPKSSANKFVDPTQSILESIPTLSQFSPQFRNTIPNLEYSVHVYSENAGFVVLNGEKYQTGNQVKPDLRVIAILKDSIVLDFRGKQFRLLALNSWVNYR